MFGKLLLVLHVGCILARNFEIPGSWSDDDEVAPNIDDYNTAEDIDNYDDFIKTNNNENTTSTSSNITNNFTFVRELKNVTKHAGDNAKLTCEVIKADAVQVDVKWFRNDAPIVIKRKSRITIKNTERRAKKSYVSRLRIIKLEVHDSGFYKCLFTNNLHIAKSSTAVLIVNPNQEANINSQDILDFDPSIPNFETILKSSNIKFINQNFNMENVNTDPNLSSPTNSGPKCELYQGIICQQFLGMKKVFIRPNVSQKMIEEKLTRAFSVVHSSPDLSVQCATYAMPTLCYSAMPICKSTDEPVPELICKEDCEMLENDICKVEYAIAKRHDVIGPVLSSEDCSILPSIDCRNLGLPVPEPSDGSETCYRGDGKDYRGKVNETVTGKKCIPWNRSHMKTANHSELLGGHNFCRNPGNTKHTRPWCYSHTSDTELCNIPECEDTRYQSALIAVVGVLTILFVVLCYCCCSMRKGRRKEREQMLPTKFKMSPGKSSIIKLKPGSEGSISGSRREMSSLIPNSASSSQKSDHRGSIKVMEFNFANIKFEEELGEGAFGKVYRGEVAISSNESMLVAIKTLKENATSKTVGEFKREVELMSELRHPNIISLLGVCMSNRLCMLFEFMSHGDLHEYLSAHSPCQDVPRNCSEAILEAEDLMNISIQVAAGMEYLCSQHFVHRDLATRNCLVGENLIVKISDFGLSRDVYSSDYYRVQKSALLPIRWMSPESILYGKFTVESDIWSYGVVLWEIYSYGLQPYYAHNNQDVVDMIRSHQVLSCPEGCPSRMYALMIECWNQVPSRRPQFAEIHSRLIQWRDTCSSSDKTDSTQLSHHLAHHTHKQLHHHHLHSYPVLMNK